MLRSVNKLHGYVVEATDGPVGKVDEVYFDDVGWAVRYLVTDTGSWLTGRRVLLPPGVLGRVDSDRRAVPVSLTRKQVEQSPDIDTDKPISRRQEEELRRHFGWASYWVADPLLGDPTFTTGPIGLSPQSMAAMAREPVTDTEGDPHLESTKDVVSYHIQAHGGEVGHVEDFVIDDQAWVIRYLVADTRNWLPGKRVLIAPQWVEKIDWAEALVQVGLDREQIRRSPEYDPAAPIVREYEKRLYEHYGRPKYWT